MYLARQLVGALLSPPMLALLMGAFAVPLRMLRRARGARWLLGGAAFIAYAGSTGVVGDSLLRPLEHSYAPLHLGGRDVGYVVVLGSGYNPRGDIPVTAALDPTGVVRLVEGVRLFRGMKGGRLVVSGGAPPGQVPPARGYAELARDLGVDAGSILMLDTALNTGEEARAVAALLGRTPFLLVTSAYHMPRAMREMARVGAQPIAAPTGQVAGEPAWGALRHWFPSGSGLGKSECALHEYLGLAALAVGIG